MTEVPSKDTVLKREIGLGPGAIYYEAQRKLRLGPQPNPVDAHATDKHTPPINMNTATRSIDSRWMTEICLRRRRVALWFPKFSFFPVALK